MWDDRNWQLALRSKNPGEAYEEWREQQSDREDPVDIDSLPNKDWLRAT